MIAFIKKNLPSSVVSIIIKSRLKVSLKFVAFASKNRFVANLYYLFFQDFSNEHQAVLKGREAYYASIVSMENSSAMLRRNAHRIEKGLIMRPRREVFAEGFISETVNCYGNGVWIGGLEEKEEKWVRDVLGEYFNVVASTPIVDKAKAIYDEIQILNNEKTKEIKSDYLKNEYYRPYSYCELPTLDLDFNDLKNLYLRRRSVRWFDDENVPLDLVQRAANIASFAPSACNRQPYRFLFCNDKGKTLAISKCAGGTSGFAENIPAIVAVVGDLSSYPYERDRHLIYIDGALAGMQFMLALETLSLSSCPINWPDIETNEREIKKIIKLKGFEKIVMLIAVGYADKKGGIPFSQKKDNSLILEDISK